MKRIRFALMIVLIVGLSACEDMALKDIIRGVVKDAETPDHTVTYNKNGATSGTVPAESTEYQEGDTVTVLGNNGNLAKTDYVFSGWNTDNNGTGTTYTAGQTFIMGTLAVDLYAKWDEPTYALTVNAGTGGTTSPSGTVYVTKEAYTQITATPTANYAFIAWSVISGNVSISDKSDASTTASLNDKAAATIQANFGYSFVWTDRTAAGSRSWRCIASSSDGTKLAACVYGGDIWTSTDGGASWTDQSSAGSRNWRSIASSSDGTKLAACVYGGDIWTSTTSGASWTDQSGSGSKNWASIASSSDGTKLAACVYNGDIWTSTTSGESWTDRSGAGSTSWLSIASSSDGAMLAACNSQYVYVSADSGTSWTTRSGLVNKSGYLASSADGMKLVVCDTYGYINVSTDRGDTWTEWSGSGYCYWNSVTSSSDGTKLVACSDDYIWTSLDGGANWLKQTSAGDRTWTGIASSSDGTKLAACVSTGDIYTGQ